MFNLSEFQTYRQNSPQPRDFKNEICRTKITIEKIFNKLLENIHNYLYFVVLKINC
jgi:hypothetical protein